jgi:hypothetical protein
MTEVNISRSFKTFAEAVTWADDEIAKYLAQGYAPMFFTVGESYDKECFNVSVSLEKQDA